MASSSRRHDDDMQVDNQSLSQIQPLRDTQNREIAANAIKDIASVGLSFRSQMFKHVETARSSICALMTPSIALMQERSSMLTVDPTFGFCVEEHIVNASYRLYSIEGIYISIPAEK